MMIFLLWVDCSVCHFLNLSFAALVTLIHFFKKSGLKTPIDVLPFPLCMSDILKLLLCSWNVQCSLFEQVPFHFRSELKKS